MKARSIAIVATLCAGILLQGCGGVIGDAGESAIDTAGDSAIDAAGVIAYSRVQGETYVLLADHLESERGWGTFGGGQEDGETLVQTASREFREETRCVYDTISDEELSENPTVSQNNFLSYVVEVAFYPAQVFESKPASVECRGQDFEERGPWVWIPLDELIVLLDAGDVEQGFTLPESYVPSGTTSRLWNETATILQDAIQDGCLK